MDSAPCTDVAEKSDTTSRQRSAFTAVPLRDGQIRYTFRAFNFGRFSVLAMSSEPHGTSGCGGTGRILRGFARKLEHGRLNDAVWFLLAPGNLMQALDCFWRK